MNSSQCDQNQVNYEGGTTAKQSITRRRRWLNFLRKTQQDYENFVKDWCGLASQEYRKIRDMTSERFTIPQITNRTHERYSTRNVGLHIWDSNVEQAKNAKI